MASASASGSYDDLLNQYRNELRSGSGGAPLVVLHPKLRGPVQCQNCGDIEGLPLAPLTGDHVHAVSLPLPSPGALNLLPVEQHSCFICLRDPSCFRCVKEMYERTRHSARVGSGGDTPLHHAARCGNLRTLYHLMVLLKEGVVHHGRAVHAVTMCNDNGETALHTAVSVGNIEIVELLLWVHPQLGQITCSNISPMYLAVSLGHKDIAKALYDASRSPTPTDISYSGPNSQNALHAAALLKFDDMTQMILRWNNDLAKDEDEKGRGPLHFAVSVPQRRFFPWGWGEAGSVRQLLVEGDSSMAYQMDNEGLCPIHVAAMTNQWTSIHTMLEKCPGCIDLRDNEGRSFLHVAVQNNAVSVVRYACRSPEFVPILNIQDKNGNTALHLAVDVQNLWVLCILLKNPAVLLNLRNMEGETALDIAKRRIREGFFIGNTDRLIYRTLELVGAQHGRFLWDKLTAKPDNGRPASGSAEREERTPAEDLEKEESAKLADSTRTLGIGSVLITSVTFAAAIARVPGASGASSSSNQAVTWHFDAFIFANALAFICAASATVCLMYSGMAMITLPFRRRHFNISVMFASYSVICLTVAFALGVYIVLAPVARAAAITISAFCPLVVIYTNAQSLYNHALVSGALHARRGFLPWLISIVCYMMSQMLQQFWPLAVILAWATYSRNRQHG